MKRYIFTLVIVLSAALCTGQGLWPGYGYKRTGEFDTIKVMLLACDTSNYQEDEWKVDTLKYKIMGIHPTIYRRLALAAERSEKEENYYKSRNMFWLAGYEVRERFSFYGDNMNRSYEDTYGHVKYFDDKFRDIKRSILIWQHMELAKAQLHLDLKQ